MATVNEKMTAIADGFRNSRGITGTLNLDKMAELAAVPLGAEMPTLTNPGAASDLASGKELIGADGSIVTGTLKESTGSILHNMGTPVYSNSEVGGTTVKSIGVKAIANEDTIVRNGSEFYAFASALDFGDATTADVVSGKTFTSLNGVKLVGTNTGGGTGGDIPLAATTKFGRERTGEEYQVPTGKSYYNGVLLLDIPDDVLAQYPYAWIRKNTTSGYYDLLLSNEMFYQSDGIRDGNEDHDKWYRTPISNPVSWESLAHTYTSWGLDTNRTVLWSNHDIPNGSATATDIYFEGTEAVQQLETKNNYDYGDYAANSENYAVANEAINEIAHRMQKRYSTYDLFTGAEVRDFIERCDFYEKGNAGSVLEIGSVVFESSVVCELTE